LYWRLNQSKSSVVLEESIGDLVMVWWPLIGLFNQIAYLVMFFTVPLNDSTFSLNGI
jgi:hypothetical protein